MTDLTSYAPIRIFFSGLLRILFSAPVFLVCYVVIHIVLHPPKTTASAADMPMWIIELIGLLFFLVGLLIFLGGVGRIVSAFMPRCFLRAGPEGLHLRFPLRGALGRFSLPEYKLAWAEIAQIGLFTYRINGIPTSSELRLHLRNGKTLKIERSLFAASSARLQAQLLALQAQGARA